MRIGIDGGVWLGFALMAGVVALTSAISAREEGAEAVAVRPAPEDAAPQRLSIYWSDGDSGRLSDGTKFRLHGVDAPETGGVGARGGADCEAERILGYDAKAVAVALTRQEGVVIVRDYGEDRYGRLVVDLEIAGEDVASKLVAGGTHRSWDYDGGERKPEWCPAS